MILIRGDDKMNPWEQIPWQIYVVLGGIGLCLLLLVILAGFDIHKKFQKHKGTLKLILLKLIPSPRAYLNFWMMWIFFLIVVFTEKRDPTIILISGLGTLYFLNEWLKEVWGERKWKALK